MVYNIVTEACTEVVYMLSNEVRKILEKNIGMPIPAVSGMDFEDEKEYVEKKLGRPLFFSKKSDRRMTSRGNPLIVRKRICTMQDIDRKIEELK